MTRHMHTDAMELCGTYHNAEKNCDSIIKSGRRPEVRSAFCVYFSQMYRITTHIFRRQQSYIIFGRGLSRTQILHQTIYKVCTHPAPHPLSLNPSSTRACIRFPDYQSLSLFLYMPFPASILYRRALPQAFGLARPVFLTMVLRLASQSLFSLLRKQAKTRSCRDLLGLMSNLTNCS